MRWRESTLARTHRRDERAFLPAAIEIGETPPPVAARVLVYVLVGAFVLAGAVACIAHVEVVASAGGRVVPSGRVKLIQPLTASVVRQIHVDEGQTVEADQLLVDLDPTNAAADRARLGQESEGNALQLARLREQLAALGQPADAPLAFEAPLDAAPERVARQRELLRSAVDGFRARLRALDREIEQREADGMAARAAISRLEATLPLLRERSATLEKLGETQIVPRTELLEFREQLVGQEKELEIQRARLRSARAAIASARERLQSERASVEQATLQELAEVERQGDALREELKKADQRSRLDQLRSPIRGVVQQLVVHTQGGVVMPAQTLMVIVPSDGNLEVDATVLNRDIGFVHADQAAVIKLEPFPFTRYGTIPGTVEHVSTDVIVDEKLGAVYRARVRLERDWLMVDGKTVRLTPGMSATVELDVGRRRLIEFVLAPLLTYRDEALREP